MSGPICPVYHEEVMSYEVKDNDGSHLGILYMDFHPRPGKKGGAWSTSIRPAHVENGEKVSPCSPDCYELYKAHRGETRPAEFR